MVSKLVSGFQRGEGLKFGLSQ